MYKLLVKVFDKWTKSQNEMIEGKGKVDSKKDMCNFAFIIKVQM